MKLPVYHYGHPACGKIAFETETTLPVKMGHEFAIPNESCQSCGAPIRLHLTAPDTMIVIAVHAVTDDPEAWCSCDATFSDDVEDTIIQGVKIGHRKR